MIRTLDLFSGIGGFALGLKRAGGFQTVAYCEIDPYCQQVLQARMRDRTLDHAPICTDIQRMDGTPFNGFVDLICGGFPCQDISTVGRGAGIHGERSGLWKEMGRLVREVRPRYVLVENVAALLRRGMETVLGDLAEIGYDAEWSVIPASAFGAPHQRERVWIFGEVRNTPSSGFQNGSIFSMGEQEKKPELERSDWWAVEPSLGRLAHGIPKRVDRLRSLGNSVVPQVVEWIGRRIVRATT